MDDTLEVVVDGVIYRLQRRGGISRLFTEILPRMCEMEVLLHITLLMTGEAKQSLPFHPRIIQRKMAPFQAFTSQAQQYFRSTRFRHFIPPHIKNIYARIVLGSTMKKAVDICASPAPRET